jgi:hypothetical protein
MDVKGRWIDNVFIERLWRSAKYEEVYLRAYANGTALAGVFPLKSGDSIKLINGDFRAY